MKEKTKQEEYEESRQLINDANRAAERLEVAKNDFRELVERQEAVAARMILGGKSEAGSKDEVKVETPKEYKERIMKGRS